MNKTSKFKVVWNLATYDDLARITAFLHRREGPKTAQSIANRIVKGAASLSQHPARCRLIPELVTNGITMYRERIVGRYRICFRIAGSRVLLVAVVDGRRDLADVLIARLLHT